MVSQKGKKLQLCSFLILIIIEGYICQGNKKMFGTQSCEFILNLFLLFDHFFWVILKFLLYTNECSKNEGNGFLFLFTFFRFLYSIRLGMCLNIQPNLMNIYFLILLLIFFGQMPFIFYHFIVISKWSNTRGEMAAPIVEPI